MTEWGWFLATPPWEKGPPQPKRGKISVPSALRDSSGDFFDPLLKAMTEPLPKRGRGRPRVKQSIDLRRAICVKKLEIGLKKEGVKATRVRIVKLLQEFARSGEVPELDATLFQSGNLSYSISRGMRELARLRSFK